MKNTLHIATAALLSYGTTFASNFDFFDTAPTKTASAKVGAEFYTALGIAHSPTSSQRESDSSASTPTSNLALLMEAEEVSDIEETSTPESSINERADTDTHIEGNKLSELEKSNTAKLQKKYEPGADSLKENLYLSITLHTNAKSQRLINLYQHYCLQKQDANKAVGESKKDKTLRALINTLRNSIQSEATSAEELETATGLLYLLDCHLLCNAGLERLED